MRGARGRVDAGVLRASGLHGELRDRAAKPVEGSGRSAVRARRWRAAAVDWRNGGAVENWEEEGNGFIPLAKGTGSKIQPVPM